MDGFDHLHTTQTLDDNPFDDPFMKRSHSPDPWASFGQDSQNATAAFSSSLPQDTTRDIEHLHAFNSAYDTTFHTQTSQTAKSFLLEEVDTRTPTEELTQPFTTNSETASVSSTQGVMSPSSSAQTPSFISHVEAVSSATETRITTPPPITITAIPASARVASPLDETPAINTPFASLALGGESMGWREDSASADDNKPTTQQTMPKGDSLDTIANKSAKEDKPIPTFSDNATIFRIVVDDPQKVGDPIRPYTMYTVHTKTNSLLYRQPTFSVLRRYSDFLWLYEALTLNNPGVFVPPLPEKSSFGRFESQFVQQRRMALEKCIQKIANHPVLQKDSDLRLFLESDGFALEIKQRKLEMAQERGGLMSAIGQTIAGPKFYETDDWFDSRKAYLDNLESQLRGLVKAMEAVSKQRSELAAAMIEFGDAVGELSGSDLSKQLSHSLVVMSDVQKRAGDLQNGQALEDIDTFMSTVDEYARIITSVRIAFASRIRCHARWQVAESEARRTKQAHERARNQGNLPQDRIPHSLAQVAEAERKAMDAKHDFDRCSKLIKSEMARFEHDRIEDFKKSMERFLGGMNARQQEVIASWENYQELLLKKVNAIQHPLNQRRQALNA